MTKSVVFNGPTCICLSKIFSFTVSHKTTLCVVSSRTAAVAAGTGTKAKRQLQQQNFRGSTISEGSSSVGLLRGAAFGIQQEFMQFKNSLLEGKANISDAKQKRKRYYLQT